MGKNIMKFLYKIYHKTVAKVIAYLVFVILIFWMSGAFKDYSTSLSHIWGIITSQETVSVLLAAVFSIFMATLVKRWEIYLEESFKIEDDHHNIISKYNGHKKKDIDRSENFVDKSGVFMRIDHIDRAKRSLPVNKVKDKYSKEYRTKQSDIFNYKAGDLYLPSINVFTNMKGDTELVFNDKREFHKLPDFVVENAGNLLAAHKNSVKNNNNTVRLNDITYKDGVLTFDTQRSMYYHMLMTNRCMDYAFFEELTIRGLYEYSSNISLLADSRLGNQIGINGLILSKDGYILIEKRDRRKTTWKNKFAQSISLALKEDELKLTEDRTIGNTYEDANENFKRIIYKTIKSNFGLKEDELEGFELKDNFLGLARDLLEGGKPNVYFYVTCKYTAKEMADVLIANAANDTVGEAFPSDKLTSDYYLIPYNDLCVNFDYVLKFNRRNCYKVYRRVFPRCEYHRYLWDFLKYGICWIFKPTFKRECGEALLATISYLELCQPRIEALKKQGQKPREKEKVVV